jgi:S-adenosylmethionine:diacylglycerol 3-amino-3-carboxypropyl transferase
MIYYSHINEDNRVERALLKAYTFSTAVAICGSGERVLSLMDSRACKKLVVVDYNEEAIFLLQLKIAALTQLSVDDYLRFIGHFDMPGEERIAVFPSLQRHLPVKAGAFWQNNLKLIKKGILDIGHFENFLQNARPYTDFWLGKSFRNIFKTGGHQHRFSAARWKLLQQIFSHKMVYRLFGNRDVAFTGSSAQLERIPLALNKIIQNGKASSCFMTHLVFKGHLLEMDQKELPPSLQKNVLAVIKERLFNHEIQINYRVADLLQFLQHENETEIAVFYSLSDILSFADFNYLHAIIQKTAVNKNCIVARSFLRNRLTTDHLALLNHYGKVSLHDEEESTGMYQVFSLQTQMKACKSN